MQIALAHNNPDYRVFNDSGLIHRGAPRRIELLGGVCSVKEALLSEGQLRTLVLGSLGYTMSETAKATYSSVDAIKSASKVVNRNLGVVGQGLFRAIDAAFAEGVLLTEEPIPENNFRVDGHYFNIIAQTPSKPIIDLSLRKAREHVAEVSGISSHATMLLAGHMAGLIPPVSQQ